ncbi:MAG: PqqD family protein [Bacteroidales bacterium]|nr:PqqD family protein [Bacteroidales bacterium]
MPDKPTVEIAPLADHYVAIVRNQDSSRMPKAVKLNASAAWILSRILEGKSDDEIAPALAARYGIPLEKALGDVKSFRGSFTQSYL